MKRYPNIESMSDSLRTGAPLLVVYLRDEHVENLPDHVSLRLPDGSKQKIATEIVACTGTAVPHIGQVSAEVCDAANANSPGSMCCLLRSTTRPGWRGLVTCGHVLTGGYFIDYGGVLGAERCTPVLLNGQTGGNWFFQQMRSNQDIAVAEVPADTNLLDGYHAFPGDYYNVDDSDLATPEPNVTILSHSNNKRDAYILDYNVGFPVNYFGAPPQYICDIILLGSTNDRQTSTTVSAGGDSGSCVFHKASGRLIGMLMGGNNKFSFVLPLQATLETFNFKPL
ncbi:hypothetical protein [Flaviaesturariibacter terrae]